MLRSSPLAIAAAVLLGCAGRDQPTSLPATEGFATTPDGVRLYYRSVGSGPETVIAPFALFHQQALDTLAVERRIVTYDPRGRGRSDSVGPAQVSLANLLLDLETVRRAVGAEQVALIGWSGAGMEMFVYALRNPTRVTRLVQLAPVAPRFVPYGEQLMNDRAARTDTAAVTALRSRIERGEFRADPIGRCRAEAEVTRGALLADPTRPPLLPDVCQFANEHPDRLGPYFGALFQSIDGFDWRDSLSSVTIPRLVIHGSRDNTPIEGNREWVTGQANARLVVVDGAGHWPHYEQPRITLEAIATFLAGGWPRTDP
jgi:pimeloyl-ACP methyl ester carboxylesterase